MDSNIVDSWDLLSCACMCRTSRALAVTLLLTYLKTSEAGGEDEHNPEQNKRDQAQFLLTMILFFLFAIFFKIASWRVDRSTPPHQERHEGCVSASSTAGPRKSEMDTRKICVTCDCIKITACKVKRCVSTNLEWPAVIHCSSSGDRFQSKKSCYGLRHAKTVHGGDKFS